MDTNEAQANKEKEKRLQACMDHAEYKSLSAKYKSVLGSFEGLKLKHIALESNNSILSQEKIQFQQMEAIKNQMIQQQLESKDKDIKRVETELIETKTELKETKAALLKIATGK